MALSAKNSITVQKVGDATEAMFTLAPGAQLGIRGPLGNGFTKGEKMLADCRRCRGSAAPAACQIRLRDDDAIRVHGRRTNSSLSTSWTRART